MFFRATSILLYDAQPFQFRGKYYAAKSLSVLTGRSETFRRLNFRIRLSNYFAGKRNCVYEFNLFPRLSPDA